MENLRKTNNFKRLLPLPEKTFILLGPRGTGKSTWLRQNFNSAFSIDLLHAEVYYRYKANPSQIREDVSHLKEHDWVIVDEAQRVPELLNEIHSLYETKRLQFAITGSSARKLKRADANLLAGRALRYDFFPLVWEEIQQADALPQLLEYGSLPHVVDQPEFAADTLASYVSTYLKEEIAAESLTRSLEPFARFLMVAAQHHGQLLNVESVAQQASVKRRSVDNYFQILEDTLVGFRLPALRLGLRHKEVAHPKFYFFDAGVARGAAGWIRESMPDAWRGFSLETLVLNELRAYDAYAKKGKNLYHYAVSGSFDVDFIVETQKKVLNRPSRYIAIEVKLAKKWRPEWTKTLKTMAEETTAGIQACYGIYLGSERQQFDNCHIMGFAEFCHSLWSGTIF